MTNQEREDEEGKFTGVRYVIMELYYLWLVHHLKRQIYL